MDFNPENGVYYIHVYSEERQLNWEHVYNYKPASE